MPLLQAIPKVRGKRGRLRQRPEVVLADHGYDHGKYRRLVRQLQVRPPIARRGTEHGSGLGEQRWAEGWGSAGSPRSRRSCVPTTPTPKSASTELNGFQQ
ncbi:transposase [Planomonospora sphaerica]|uniref:Transposase n=1 Tax=Planomonospora sphaerica TaxID=161355 RepID=A0A171DLS9_9ACTN|nr:transposase [Planomonospora sphaerica]